MTASSNVCFPMPCPDGTNILLTCIVVDGKVRGIVDPPSWETLLSHCPGATTNEQIDSYNRWQLWLEAETRAGNRRARGALRLWALCAWYRQQERVELREGKDWYTAEATPTAFGERTGD